jgi:hypothetical protein
MTASESTTPTAARLIQQEVYIHSANNNNTLTVASETQIFPANKGICLSAIAQTVGLAGAPPACRGIRPRKRYHQCTTGQLSSSAPTCAYASASSNTLEPTRGDAQDGVRRPRQSLQGRPAFARWSVRLPTYETICPLVYLSSSVFCELRHPCNPKESPPIQLQAKAPPKRGSHVPTLLATSSGAASALPSVF